LESEFAPAGIGIARYGALGQADMVVQRRGGPRRLRDDDDDDNDSDVSDVSFSSTSTYHPTDLLTARGVAHLVVHGTTGSTMYEMTSLVRLESSGGVLSTVDMVVQRRDGPRRLRDRDDGEVIVGG